MVKDNMLFTPLTTVKPVAHHDQSVVSGPLLDGSALHVHQRGYAVIDRFARYTKLGVSGHTESLAVIGHHAQQRLLFVAHFDLVTLIEPSIISLKAWFKLAGINQEDLAGFTIAFDGGDHQVRHIKESLRNIFDAWGVTDITDHNPDYIYSKERHFTVNVLDGRLNHRTKPLHLGPAASLPVKTDRAKMMDEGFLEPDYVDLNGIPVGL